MNDGDRSHSEQRWKAQKATEREREQHEIQLGRPLKPTCVNTPSGGRNTAMMRRKMSPQVMDAQITPPFL